MTEAGTEISPEDIDIYQAIRRKNKPVVVVINKADRGDRRQLLPLMDRWLREFKADVVVPISALHKDGVERVESEILKRIQEGPVFYPEDQVTDRSQRFLVSEIIREKIMAVTREEVPYSIAILIEAFREPAENDSNPVTHIRAAIICEKDSQKIILVGKKGAMIKRIGEMSRADIETELGTKVYLELFVRVEKEWTKDPQKVQEFAYET